MLIPFLASNKSIAVRSLFSCLISKYTPYTKSVSSESDPLLPKYKFQSFIKPKLSTIDSQGSDIITALSTKSKVDKTLLAMLDRYLNSLENNNTPEGLIVILIALNQVKDSGLESYNRRIIEFIIRFTDVSLFQCDSYTFLVLLKALQMRLSESQQKIKVSVIKYFIIQLMIVNMKQIDQKNITNILKMVKNFDDRGSVSQYTRFLKLSNLLQEKLHTIFKSEVQGSIQEHNYLNVTFFIVHLLNFYSNFPPRKNQYAQTLFYWLKKRIFVSQIPIHSFSLDNCYKSFPYKEKTQDGIYYKDLVLDCVLKRRKQPQIHSFKDWSDSIFCYSILSFQFYKVMNEVQFRYEGPINYLLKQDVVAPPLPAQFWDIYAKFPALVENNRIIYHIIKQIYPQRYVQFQANTKTIKPPHTENQMKVRLDLVCEKLGLKRQRQIQISGRYVDFLIQGNIVIECDGDHHFNMHSMEYDQSTQFRNLHILLLGYRLILINIFEYNVNRDLQSLTRLISQKIEFLHRTNAILVI